MGRFTNAELIIIYDMYTKMLKLKSNILLYFLSVIFAERVSRVDDQVEHEIVKKDCEKNFLWKKAVMSRSFFHFHYFWVAFFTPFREKSIFFLFIKLLGRFIFTPCHAFLFNVYNFCVAFSFPFCSFLRRLTPIRGFL